MAQHCAGVLRAAAATAVLINKQGAPLEGAIWWAINVGYTASDASSYGPVFTANIASQGCAQTPHKPAAMKRTFESCQFACAEQTSAGWQETLVICRSGDASERYVGPCGADMCR